MLPLYNAHGFVFWSEREIRIRKMMENHFSSELHQALLDTNPAWRMIQVEAPLITPRHFISSNYTNEDVWVTGDTSENAVLRPETTPGSYLYAEHLLVGHTGVRPPICIWQTGKSFRRESSETSYGHMRLNEFYQQEFQCIYTSDSKNDYHSAIVPKVSKMIQEIIGVECRTVPSDRIPSYSEITLDIEAKTALKWLEICSISLRNDTKFKYNNKELKVVEVAVGLDRCVHVFESCR
jgi:glycyl-tRNA synthetase